MKLYELTNQYAALMDAYERDDATVEELAEQIRTIDDEINAKILGLARLVKNLKADQDAVAIERKRLQAREKAVENRITSLKAYMKDSMLAVGTLKIMDSVLSVGVKNSAGSVNALNEALIPEDYWKPQPPTLDKAAILERLKAGESVPGCELKTGEYLSIS